MATSEQPAKTRRSQRILGLRKTELAVLVGLLFLILCVLGAGGAYVITQNLNNPAQAVLAVTVTATAGAIPTSTILAYPTLPPEWTSTPEATSTSIATDLPVATEVPIATSKPPTSVPLGGDWQVVDVYGYPGRKSIRVYADSPIVGPYGDSAVPFLGIECGGPTMVIFIAVGLDLPTPDSSGILLVTSWYDQYATLVPGLFDRTKSEVSLWGGSDDNRGLIMIEAGLRDEYVALVTHKRMLVQTQVLSPNFDLASMFFNLTGLADAIGPYKALCGVG